MTDVGGAPHDTSADLHFGGTCADCEARKVEIRGFRCSRRARCQKWAELTIREGARRHDRRRPRRLFGLEARGPSRVTSVPLGRRLTSPATTLRAASEAAPAVAVPQRVEGPTQQPFGKFCIVELRCRYDEDIEVVRVEVWHGVERTTVTGKPVGEVRALADVDRHTSVEIAVQRVRTSVVECVEARTWRHDGVWELRSASEEDLLNQRQLELHVVNETESLAASPVTSHRSAENRSGEHDRSLKGSCDA